MSCLCRWAQFRQCIDDIEASVKSLRDDDPVSYKQSIGGAYYVSVTSGFYCIDIRKFYLPYGKATDVRPRVRKIINSINPTLGTVLLCYLRNDHQKPIGALQCRECNPFTTDLYWNMSRIRRVRFNLTVTVHELDDVYKIGVPSGWL